MLLFQAWSCCFLIFLVSRTISNTCSLWHWLLPEDNRIGKRWGSCHDLRRVVKAPTTGAHLWGGLTLATGKFCLVERRPQASLGIAAEQKRTAIVPDGWAGLRLSFPTICPLPLLLAHLFPLNESFFPCKPWIPEEPFWNTRSGHLILQFGMFRQCWRCESYNPSMICEFLHHSSSFLL